MITMRMIRVGVQDIKKFQNLPNMTLKCHSCSVLVFGRNREEIGLRLGVLLR